MCVLMPAEFGDDWIRPQSLGGIAALTTTRAGGVSRGPFASLNLAGHVGDDPHAVADNRRRLLRRLEVDQVQWLQQVHGTRCVRAHAGAIAPGPEADAAWTDAPGLAVAVLTADCLPVVFAARDASSVAVAHAGWRGLVDGVLEATLASLPASPAGVTAWLGPAIGAARYEVGSEVRQAAVDRIPGAQASFARGRVPGKLQMDLAGLARHLLEAAGVAQVLDCGVCCASDQRFYSYRRDGRTGRMATLAWLVR